MKKKRLEILLTTLLNFKSKIPSLEIYTHFFQRRITLIVGCILLSGCVSATSPEQFFELTPENIKHQALQTRMFETSNEKELLSASAAVLQDLGFQIEESAFDVGVLRALKERGAREYGQEIGQVFLFLLGLYGQSILIMPVDLHQQIGATLSIRPLKSAPPRYNVRIVFHRKIWKGDGEAGRQYIPPGAERMEMIYDPGVYQHFFAKLAKSIFLEAHQI